MLEAAYCTGLETLNESLQLPESLKVELGFFSSSEQMPLQLGLVLRRSAQSITMS